MDYIKSKISTLKKLTASRSLALLPLYLQILENLNCELLGKSGIQLTTKSLITKNEANKILNALVILSKNLKGKTIYNPYSRTAFLTYFLLASNVAKKLILNDINYPFNTAYTNSYYINPAQNISNICNLSNGKILNMLSKVEITNNSINDTKQINADIILTIFTSNSYFSLQTVVKELQYLKNKFNKPTYLINSSGEVVSI